jgi:transcription termination factor Rho
MMRGRNISRLICYDDHRQISEDLRKRFSDPSKYKVECFHSRRDFMRIVEKPAETRSCRIAMIVVPDKSGQTDIIGKMTDRLSRTDPDAGIILIVPAPRMDEIRKVIKFNIDAYIAKNSNAILRIHNEVKKLVSEHNINVFRKRRNLSLYVLAGYIVLTALSVLIAYFRFPGYF